LKPILLIIKYYHSKLLMTNSKRQADARWITTQFVLFFFIDI